MCGEEGFEGLEVENEGELLYRSSWIMWCRWLGRGEQLIEYEGEDRDGRGAWNDRISVEFDEAEKPNLRRRQEAGHVEDEKVYSFHKLMFRMLFP